MLAILFAFIYSKSCLDIGFYFSHYVGYTPMLAYLLPAYLYHIYAGFLAYTEFKLIEPIRESSITPAWIDKVSNSDADEDDIPSN